MTPALKVLNGELNYVRSLRVSRDFGLARAAIDREEVLLAEIAQLEAADNVLPMAAGFARRDYESEGKGCS